MCDRINFKKWFLCYVHSYHMVDFCRQGHKYVVITRSSQCYTNYVIIIVNCLPADIVTKV